MKTFVGHKFLDFGNCAGRFMFDLNEIRACSEREVRAVVIAVALSGDTEEGMSFAYSCEGRGSLLKRTFQHLGRKSFATNSEFPHAFQIGVQDAAMAVVRDFLRKLCEEQGVDFDAKWAEAEATREVKYLLYCEERGRGVSHDELVKRDPLCALFLIRYTLEGNK